MPQLMITLTLMPQLKITRTTFRTLSAAVILVPLPSYLTPANQKLFPSTSPCKWSWSIPKPKRNCKPISPPSPHPLFILLPCPTPWSWPWPRAWWQPSVHPWHGSPRTQFQSPPFQEPARPEKSVGIGNYSIFGSTKFEICWIINPLHSEFLILRHRATTTTLTL